jgi:hypothetical protein
MERACQRLLPLLLLLALTATMQAQFAYTTNGGTITITKYTGADAMVAIPSATNGFACHEYGQQTVW